MTASQDQWPLTITLCQTFPAPASQAGGVSGDLGARWEEQRGWGTVCIYRFYMSGCTVCTVYILYIYIYVYIYMSQCQPGWRHDEARFSAGASCSFGLAPFLHVRHEGTQLLEKKYICICMCIYIYCCMYYMRLSQEQDVQSIVLDSLIGIWSTSTCPLVVWHSAGILGIAWTPHRATGTSASRVSKWIELQRPPAWYLAKKKALHSYANHPAQWITSWSLRTQFLVLPFIIIMTTCSP